MNIYSYTFFTILSSSWAEPIPNQHIAQILNRFCLRTPGVMVDIWLELGP